VDWWLDASAATHLLDWQITYSDGSAPVAQTQASVASSAGTAIGLTLGWTTAQTGTVRYADVVVSTTRGHYPLGDMKVYPLKVDPAGTVTISGTTSNFDTFSAGGTLAGGFDATTARGAIDDVPPTIGGSSDGIAIVTGHATDYVEIPLETLDLAAIPGSIRGVRLCVAGGAASATANSVRISAHDGTTEHILYPEADPNWDSTSESWICRMVRPASGRIIWDQSKLDALVARIGAADATPDVWIHALVGEAVVAIAGTSQLFGDLASAAVDADSAGVVTVTVAAPAGYNTDLYYEQNTSPTTVPVTGGTSHTEPILAPDAPTTNYIAAYPAAEPYTG
jgi:hypothetical protein